MSRKHSFGLIWCGWVVLLFAENHLLAQTPQIDAEITFLEESYKVNPDMTADLVFHARWKSFGRTGLSQIRIPYSPDLASVEFKWIKTIKKDGTEIKGDPTVAFDCSPPTDPRAPMFADFRWRTILPPNVDTGDSVEYEATQHVRKWTKAGEFWITQLIRSDLPVRSETVVLDLPADRKVTFWERSSFSGKTEFLNGRRIEPWNFEHPDPAKVPVDHGGALFMVSSFPNWNALSDWIRSLNAEASRLTPEIKDLAAKLIRDKSTDDAKISALYSYVATKVRYIAVSFGMGRVQPHSASIVLANSFGDCKDQTALLSALLGAAGYKTHAVLAFPGRGVQVPEVPDPDQFNHEFVAVETKSGLIFLDPSPGPAPPGALVAGLRDKKALLIGDPDSSIIEIPTEPEAPHLSIELTGRITDAGVFDGSLRVEYQGILEVPARRLFIDGADADKEKAFRDVAGPRFKNAVVRQIRTADPTDLSKPFWIQAELSEPKLFPANERSMNLGANVQSTASMYRAIKNLDKPLPLEAVKVDSSLDLEVSPAFIVSYGDAIHRKTAFGSMDSEYSSGFLCRADSSLISRFF